MDNILDDEVSTRLRCSINEYGAYTIMADETSINNKSFLGVYARFLEESDGRVKTVEELLFITAVTSTKAEALFVAINQFSQHNYKLFEVCLLRWCVGNEFGR